MWVAPESRGTGIAVELVEHVLDWAYQRRMRVVLSVEPGNDRAARLYEKCGFVEIPQPAELPYQPNADNRFYAYALAPEPWLAHEGSSGKPGDSIAQ